MPFTPFHLGPGALFKAALGKRFSFLVFAGSQVLIDLEPGVRMMIGTDLLHGPTHSVAGALAIGALATLIGKPISNFVLRIAAPDARLVTWTASTVGAFIGTLSHVALDAVMHRDLAPLWPWSGANALLNVISVDALHGACLIVGVLGVCGGAARLLLVRRERFGG